MRSYADQTASGGESMGEIVERVLELARPEPKLRWLDIGCGRGDLLRRVRDRWAPAALSGIDAIDWLDEDLRNDVNFRAVPAEDAGDTPPADRVLMVEVIEHLEAPWSALRTAARLVAPGGRIVISTPNVTSLRNRLELLTRGGLTSFRSDFEPHISPALVHVTTRILNEEGLSVAPPRFAGVDVVSLTNGHVWPDFLQRRYPSLLSVSVIVCGDRPRGSAAS